MNVNKNTLNIYYNIDQVHILIVVKNEVIYKVIKYIKQSILNLTYFL